MLPALLSLVGIAKQNRYGYYRLDQVKTKGDIDKFLAGCWHELKHYSRAIAVWDATKTLKDHIPNTDQVTWVSAFVHNFLEGSGLFVIHDDLNLENSIAKEKELTGLMKEGGSSAKQYITSHLKGLCTKRNKTR